MVYTFKICCGNLCKKIFWQFHPSIWTAGPYIHCNIFRICYTFFAQC